MFVSNPSTLAHICQSIRYNLVSVLLLSCFVKVRCLSYGFRSTPSPKSNPIHTIFTNCAPFPLHFHSISISIWISTPLKGSTPPPTLPRFPPGRVGRWGRTVRLTRPRGTNTWPRPAVGRRRPAGSGEVSRGPPVCGDAPVFFFVLWLNQTGDFFKRRTAYYPTYRSRLTGATGIPTSESERASDWTRVVGNLLRPPKTCR